MRVLVFGASVTQGFWDTEGGWVQRLWKHYTELRSSDWSRPQPAIFNLGISGDGTTELLKRLENETIARKWPDEDFAFIISIGINDSFIRKRDEENISAEQFAVNLNKLCEITKKYSSKTMFVGLHYVDESRTNPVSWIDISYKNERIAIYDSKIKDLVSRQGLAYTPLYDEFKRQHELGRNLYQDGLHPNNEGHQLIFELVQPELDKLLNT